MFILNTVHGTNNQAQIYTHTHTHMSQWIGAWYGLVHFTVYKHILREILGISGVIYIIFEIDGSSTDA